MWEEQKWKKQKNRCGGSWWGQRASLPCNLNACNVEQHGYLLSFLAT